MLNVTKTAAEKRKAFKDGINSGTLQRVPGAFSPLVARLLPPLAAATLPLS